HNDQFGVSTAIAADGNFVVVGAPGKNCPLLLATQGQQSLSGCGAVYVYERSGLDWPLQSRYFPTGAGAYNRLGSSVAIDSKAGHAAAGATGWDTQASSARTDEPHPQTDNEGIDGGSNSDGDGDGGNSGNSDTNGDNNSNSGADTVDVGSDYIDTDNDNIDTGAVFIWPIQNH
ncbi:MAG: hypothetical protein K8963_02615, partial [Proteobacteria bacterium]|nr:hypothetical protein [Pseudomonadota bacterium]